MEERMKAIRSYVVILMALLLAGPLLLAQDKVASASKAPSVSLKLQVTVVEKEGDKKVANLPYTFYVRAGDGGGGSPWTKLRSGSRVPVYVGKEHGMQYIDVGTNIDARGINADDGRFDISLNLERSWVAGEVEVPLDKSDSAVVDPGSTRFKEPIIRQFKTELTLAMRDGQTSEVTEAADPGSGRVLTITVMLNVVK
jgi:hypothetical protein